VPAGALQIETGLEYGRARVGGGPTERQLSVQGALRLGLTPALEVSLEGKPFVWLRAAGEHHGSGDYALGLKYRFHAPAADGAGPALAVKPLVKLPTASEPIGSILGPRSPPTSAANASSRVVKASRSMPWMTQIMRPAVG